jgi:hypothetical protein
MGSGGDVEDMLKDEKNPPPLDEDPQDLCI